MRRLILIILITSFAAHGIYSEDTNANGVILELTGDVKLKPAGSSSFIKADVGDEVAFDTIISTGFKSSAVIEVGNSIITIQQLTQLSISSSTDVNLQTGRIKIESKEPNRSADIFTVQSPGTSSSVRGTNFEFNTVNMKAKKGKASFSGISGPAVIVHEGREDNLGADKKPAGSSSASCSLPAAPGGISGGSSGGGGASGGGASSGGGGASGGGGSCCD